MAGTILSLQDVGLHAETIEPYSAAATAQRLIMLFNLRSSQMSPDDREALAELIMNKPWEHGSLASLSSHPLYQSMWTDGIANWANINYPNFFVLVVLYGDPPLLGNITEAMSRLYGTPCLPSSLEWPGPINEARLQNLVREEREARDQAKLPAAQASSQQPFAMGPGEFDSDPPINIFSEDEDEDEDEPAIDQTDEQSVGGRQASHDEDEHKRDKPTTIFHAESADEETDDTKAKEAARADSS